MNSPTAFHHSDFCYAAKTQGYALIPPSEKDLPSVVAEPFFHVSAQPLALEGPAFDRAGNLYFVDVHGGQVMCLDTGGKLKTIYREDGLRPAGIAIHKDGRLFVACLGDFKTGCILAMDPNGENRNHILSSSQGYVPDDLVFDAAGGFYFTDFKGNSTDPAGGVYYVSPDFSAITPVLRNLCVANGVALSEDEKTLWTTEFSAGRLHRIALSAPAEIALIAGANVAHHFCGPAPDSMRTDADGNVYVAMFNQGRILAFSSYGLPIGQILLPGRDENKFLKSTSLAFFPGERNLVIVAKDDNAEGAMIFKSKGFAKGTRLFSHQ